MDDIPVEEIKRQSDRLAAGLLAAWDEKDQPRILAAQ